MVSGRAQESLAGLYAALLSPRKAGTSEVDVAKLLDYLDRVTHAGVDGLVLFGSTGEFVHFDVAERARATGLAIRRSQVPVLVNISHSTLTSAMSLAEGAINIGAAGLLLMPPYFYRYSDDDIFAFYEQIAVYLDGACPLLLYNLPAFTNPLSFPLIERLLQLPGVAGIKDSSGDPRLLDQLSGLRSRHDTRWLAGNERLYSEARASGADGLISGVAAAIPELMVALQQQKIGSRLVDRLNEFLSWSDRFSAVVAIRETAIVRGWICNEPALPVSPETQAKLGEFRKWVRPWLAAVTTECRNMRLTGR